MLTIRFRYFLILLALVFVGCAKRGTITGGTKDTIAPILVRSFPKNGTVNFNQKEIKLYFDEYVKLKDVNKQLVVSPPMNNAPEITPSSASKFITIRLRDTLKPNTTYSLNFGQSIQDNNESIPYPQFKYVFSTGSYIDSLTVQGRIKDALENKPDNFVNVMLYEMDDKYNDSIIYNEKPRYVTNTLDSLTSFKIENVKAGKYLLVAVKDQNKNYKFDPKTEKIAFYQEPVTVPSTENYALSLFRENAKFKATKPYQVSGNRAVMPFEGDAKNVKFTLKNGDEMLPVIATKFPEKDSVQLWFKPVKADSLNLSVEKENYSKSFVFKIKNQKKDSINFKPVQSSTLALRETYTIVSNTPLVKIDAAKMSLSDKNKAPVAFTTEYDDYNQKLKFNFKKEPLEKYTLQLLPGALTDFNESVNDTLNYKFSTKNTSEYGYMKVKLKNAKSFPVIVQLTDAKGKVLAEEYSENSETVEFFALEPNTFTIRVIYDTNKNKVWDTGNFLEKRQAEEVIYLPEPVTVRSNWDWDQDIDLAK